MTMSVICTKYVFFPPPLSWGVCNTDEIRWNRDDGFIDFYPFHFMFPNGKKLGKVGPSLWVGTA